MLSGFNQPRPEYFPAPLPDPLLCFYSNLSASGLYNNNETASAAAQEIISYIESLCLTRGADKTEADSIRAEASRFLHDRILSGQCKVYELYLYFSDPQSFAIILNGEFDWKRLSGSIGVDRIIPGSESISARLRLPFAGKEMLYLYIDREALVICPDNIAGNVMAQLTTRRNLLGDAFSAFSKMVKVRPALAAEVNLAALPEKNPIALPEYLAPLRYARLIVSSQLTKLQLFVPDADQREKMLRQVEKQVGGLRESAGNLVDFAANLSGNSIFVEAPAGEELERLFSSRSFAFFAHFFVRAHKNELVVSSRGDDVVID